ncbi:MAG TPA: hypothetical protein VFJ16_01420 [Longimicrobium sp.]|nr:hypothetical protein [Longimicrobium sp.]
MREKLTLALENLNVDSFTTAPVLSPAPQPLATCLQTACRPYVCCA